MLQVRQVISLVTSHPYLPFCRHIIPILHFILIENNFLVLILLLPARASEQGNVIGLVSVYIVVIKKKL